MVRVLCVRARHDICFSFNIVLVRVVLDHLCGIIQMYYEVDIDLWTCCEACQETLLTSNTWVMETDWDPLLAVSSRADINIKEIMTLMNPATQTQMVVCFNNVSLPQVFIWIARADIPPCH